MQADTKIDLAVGQHMAQLIHDTDMKSPLVGGNASLPPQIIAKCGCCSVLGSGSLPLDTQLAERRSPTMDCFNTTIKDGKVISTRRGLQVSKHKFNGIYFVNSCPQEINNAGISQFSISGPSTPQKQQQRQCKPVDAERKTTLNVPCFDSKFIIETPQEKGQKRLAPKGKPLRKPSDISSHHSSRASSQAPSLEGHFPQFFVSQDSNYQVDPVRGNPGLAFPTSMPQMRPSSVSEKDWNLFHHYFQDVPLRIYPYEDLLTHNPGRTTGFYCMAVRHTTSFHCVLMSGSIAEAILDYSDTKKGYAYHISKICSILNRKLDNGKAVDAVTLCCIATLAANGVSHDV